MSEEETKEYKLLLTKLEFDTLSDSIADCLEMRADNREYKQVGVLACIKFSLDCEARRIATEERNRD